MQSYNPAMLQHSQHPQHAPNGGPGFFPQQYHTQAQHQSNPSRQQFPQPPNSRQQPSSNPNMPQHQYQHYQQTNAHFLNNASFPNQQHPSMSANQLQNSMLAQHQQQHGHQAQNRPTPNLVGGGSRGMQGGPVPMDPMRMKQAQAPAHMPQHPAVYSSRSGGVGPRREGEGEPGPSSSRKKQKVSSKESHPHNLAPAFATGREIDPYPSAPVDEVDGLTDVDLAIRRYKLRHELMNEIFGPHRISQLPPPPIIPKAHYSLAELESKLTELQDSNVQLKEKQVHDLVLFCKGKVESTSVEAE